jgi:YD repeat-containing protein
MRKILLLLMCLISLHGFAADHTYDVSGEDENGKTIEGTIESNNGEREVSGELTDEDGNTHEFTGDWDGYRQISGETDEGVSVELSTE